MAFQTQEAGMSPPSWPWKDSLLRIFFMWPSFPWVGVTFSAEAIVPQTEPILDGWVLLLMKNGDSKWNGGLAFLLFRGVLRLGGGCSGLRDKRPVFSEFVPAKFLRVSFPNGLIWHSGQYPSCCGVLGILQEIKKSTEYEIWIQMS